MKIKFLTTPYLIKNETYKGIFRIMKICFILLFVFSFQLMALNTEAQEAVIELETNSITIGQLIEEIEKQTDYLVVYSNREVDANRKVDVQRKSDKVSAYLDEAFAGTDIGYDFENNYIVLMKKTRRNASTVAEMIRSAQQQGKTITGKVVDVNGEPIIGANIIEVGTTNGTITDIDGNFSLKVADNATIRVSYIGYVEQEINTAEKTSFNITLVVDTQALEEVVVIGYGTQRKINLTGAVESVSGDKISQRPVSNTTLALQGISPGLNIINRGGAPGNENIVMRIRGTGTLNNANPLVIIDGIPQSLSSIEPGIIESISILKDAASAAIYGARAANGVILVTTKRGSKVGPTISYNNYFGTQSKSFWPESAKPGDYLRLANEAFENAGQPPKYSDEYIRNVEAGTEPLKYPFTDWVPHVFDDNAMIQNHSLQISNGGDRGNVMVSLNYLDQDGIVKNHNFEKYSIRVNTDLFLSKKFTLSTDMLYRRRHYKGVGRPPEEIVGAIFTVPSTIVGEYPNGSFDFVAGNYNPIALIKKSGTDNRIMDDLMLNLGFNYKLAKNLNLKGYYSVNNIHTEQRLYRNKLENISYYTGEPLPVGSWWVTNFLQEDRNRQWQSNYKLYGDYSKTFSLNSLNILVGYDEISSKSRTLMASRDNFYSNEIQELNGGSPTNRNNAGSSSEWRLRSFFGRFNYSYDDKYLFETNLRLDGSSRFAKGKKYGIFPSFSAGWRINNENFLKSNQSISNLKLRASWGRLGNQEVGLYRYLGVYALNLNYNFNNKVVTGAAQTTAPNENISWESTTITNIGLDIGLFKNKLSLTADYFWKNTEGILHTLPIPPTVGITPPVQNAASVSNNGWELTAIYNSYDRNKDFHYIVSFNISDVKNKITDLKGTGPIIGANYASWQPEAKFAVWEEGFSINSIYGYKSKGLYRTEEDLQKYPKYNPQVTLGDIIYEDINKDGKLDSQDRVIIGNSDPRYTFGLNFEFFFKGFDVTTFWQGVLKSTTGLEGPLIEGPDWENYTTVEMARDRYHPTKNPNGTLPRVSYGNSWNILVSDFWLQDTKYIRLKNFQLGYTVAPDILKKVLNASSELRLFVSGENMLTFTPSKWVDPEFPTGRLKYFPHTKTLSVGVNINF